MKRARTYLIAAITVAACSAPSTAPAGWHAAPTAPNVWHRGGGASLETYAYTSVAFSGMLPDLASQVTIDALLRHRGARLRSSIPLNPCPGAAGLATFTLAGGRTLQEGFAVHDGRALRATYTRPSTAPADPAVAAAMQNLLC